MNNPMTEYIYVYTQTVNRFGKHLKYSELKIKWKNGERIKIKIILQQPVPHEPWSES